MINVKTIFAFNLFGFIAELSLSGFTFSLLFRLKYKLMNEKYKPK